MTTIRFNFILIACFVLVITNISILLINTDLANAIVICIDKYNQTHVIPCSDQNAIVRTGSQQVNVNNSSTTNTTNFMSDVRVVSQQSQRTAGFIFLIHYIVFGNVANFGNGTSGPITVHLQITSPQGAVLYSTERYRIP
jgi:hypothetical protein